MKNPCNCGNAVVGDWTADQCRFCWLGLNDPQYIKLFRDQLPFSTSDCIYRGPEVGRSQCESCGGNVQVKRFACAKHGECSLEKDVGVRVCGGCGDKRQLELHHAHDWYDLGSLIPGERNFNSSLLRFRGRLIMATRHHTHQGWSKGRISLAILSNDFREASDVRFLDIDHPLANHGTEDPRLFIHNDALHVGFTGVQNFGPAIATHQLYALLGDNLKVEKVYAPNYQGRQPWEKNWGFFSEGGQLYAVYMIGGHKILRIDGDKAELVHESPTEFPAAIGEPRGGASPIKRGNEFYSFFHDIRPGAERREYKLCFYTFEDRPPFRINRVGRVPLFEVTKSHRPNDWTPDVVFPGGAFLEDNLWHVASGYYDQWSWLLRFDVNKLETLADVAAGGRDATYTFRDNLDDLDVWQNVYNRNEYELPERIDGWRVVDIGGHIGSFARLCLDRGAAHVASIEAHPAQREVYKRNLGPYNGQATLIPAAVFGKAPGDTATLVGRGCIARILGDSDRTGGEPVSDSQQVPTVDLGPVECDLLKLDVEGCEYEILSNTDLSGVKRIVGEGHLFDGLPDSAWLKKLLETKGFVVTIRETGPLTYLFWATSSAVQASPTRV